MLPEFCMQIPLSKDRSRVTAIAIGTDSNSKIQVSIDFNLTPDSMIGYGQCIQIATALIEQKSIVGLLAGKFVIIEV